MDKIEPQFHLYFLTKHQNDLTPFFELGWSAAEYREHRRPYVSEFAVIQRFDDRLYDIIKATNFHRAK